jgi:hypothetical protein
LALEKTSQSYWAVPFWFMPFCVMPASAASTGDQSGGAVISIAGCKSTSAPKSASRRRNSSACPAGRVTRTRWPNSGLSVNHRAAGSTAATSPTMTITGGRILCAVNSSVTRPSVQRMVTWSGHEQRGR